MAVVLARFLIAGSLVIALAGAAPLTAEASASAWTGPSAGSWHDPANWTPAGVPGPDSQVTISAAAAVSAEGAPVSFATLTLGGGAGASKLAVFATDRAGAVLIAAGGELEQNGTGELAFQSVDVGPGGRLTHAKNGETGAALHILRLNVGGSMTVQAGGAIDLAGRGYGGGISDRAPWGPAPGYGPGGGGGQGAAWPFAGGGGGGHGGAGGDGGGANHGGPANDSESDPAEPGSGGGAGNGSPSGGGAGGAGGGAALLTVAGAFTLDGAIDADGAPGSASCYQCGGNGGGGAGGTVSLIAGSLAGAGSATADGGAGSPDATNANGPVSQGGGGAGGRLRFSAASCSARLRLSVIGGAAGGGQARDGSRGTVQSAGTACGPAPVAGADAASTPEDTPALLRPLDNDQAGGSPDRLTIASFTPPSHGSLSLSRDLRSLTYTPAQDFNGSDGFVYTASDGISTSLPAAVSITVAAVNDPPVSAGDAAYTKVGVPVTLAVLANDSDVDDPNLALKVAAYSQPSHGALSLAADQRTLTYTPQAGFSGNDSFTYTATDGRAQSAPAAVTIAVSDTKIWLPSSGGDWSDGANWAGGSVPTAADDAVIDVEGAVTAAAPISFKSLTLGDASGTFSTTLKLSTGITSGGALVVNKNAVFEQAGALPLTVASLSVEAGGRLTHSPNGAGQTKQYLLDLTVSGSAQLKAGSLIDLDGRGYRGGVSNQAPWGPAPGDGPGGGQGQGCAWPYAGGGGGGHGGAGGDGGQRFTDGIAPNKGGAANDLAAFPSDLGSGGGGGNGSCSGGGTGGSGGGALRLTVAGVLSLDGVISADGAQGSGACYQCGGDGGGGSGGTINITAGTVSGSGIARARGGAGGYSGSLGPTGSGGGGGGGRIRLNASSGGAGVTLDAAGGSAAPSALPGGAGTIERPVFDHDYDGVLDVDDRCPGTAVESGPIDQNHLRWLGGANFKINAGTKKKADIVDYAALSLAGAKGCSCVQLAALVGKKSSTDAGCSLALMQDGLAFLGVPQKLKPAAAGPDDAFRLAEAYCYPNPARAGQTPTLRVETGRADSLDIRIYDLSGSLLRSARLGAPAEEEGRFVYDWPWDGPSGVYTFTATAHREGLPDVKALGKCALLR